LITRLAVEDCKLPECSPADKQYYECKKAKKECQKDFYECWDDPDVAERVDCNTCSIVECENIKDAKWLLLVFSNGHAGPGLAPICPSPCCLLSCFFAACMQ